MPPKSYDNLAPIWIQFRRHSAPGAPGSPLTPKRRPLADITNSNRNTAVIKTKSKSKSKTWRRRSQSTKWRPDYAAFYRMSESDDEEVKPAITNWDSHTGRSKDLDTSASGGVRDLAPSAVIGAIEVPAKSDDVQPKGQGAATQDDLGSRLAILKVGPAKVQQGQQQMLEGQLSLPHSTPSSSDHSIFRREVLPCKLNEADANEARKIFDLIRGNVEQKRDVEYLINRLDHLFALVKQRLVEERDRIAEDYDRLSIDKAKVEQKLQLFNDVIGAADGMETDG